MKTGALLCCFTLCLVLSSVISIDDLNNIQDLRNIDFGRRNPRHGLMLLHWFVNNINIDNNNVIRCVRFNPARGDYGFHRYHNSEGIFPEYPDCVYYVLGNLGQSSSRALPRYVRQDYNNARQNNPQRIDPLSNFDRIVIRVQRNTPRRIERVYITQHYYQDRRYDPDNTYRVSTSLLQEIQDLINQHRVDQLLNNLYRRERGLSRLLSAANYNRAHRDTRYSQSHFCRNTRNNAHRPHRSLDTNLQCETPGEIKLEVKSTSNGYARISWSEIPESLVTKNINIGLYKDDQSLEDYPLNGRTYGTIDTSTYLNSGLQVILFTTNKEIIWVGPEFEDTNGALPTKLTGYDASLQLYTKDGYACARLFIKKSFINWESVFSNSWVGFYSSPEDYNNKYKTYQHVIKFEKNANQDLSEEYDIYEYKSGTAIGPGVQARFLLDNDYTSVVARTKPWV